MTEYLYRGGKRCLWVTASKRLFIPITDDIDMISPRGRGIKKLDITQLDKEQDETKFQVLRVTYKDIGEFGKAAKIEKWLGDENYDGLVRAILLDYWIHIKQCFVIIACLLFLDDV